MEKPKADKVTLIFRIIAAAASLAVIFIAIKRDNFNGRLKQLERIAQTQPSMARDSLIKAIEIKDLKEEYYLTQMDIQSNWYILYVTTLFVVFSLVGYSVFRYELESIEDKNKAKYVEYDKHFEVFRNAYKNLNLKHLELTRNWIASLALTAAKENNLANAVDYALQAVDYNILVIKEKKDSVDEVKKLTEDSINFLEVTKKHLEKFDSTANPQLRQIFIGAASYDRYIETIDKIGLSDSRKIKELSSDIRFLLKKILNKW